MEDNEERYPDPVITIRVSPRQREAVERLAKADDRPISAWIRRLIDKAIEKETAPNGQ